MAVGFLILFVILIEVAFLTFLGRAYWSYTQLKKKGLKAQGEIIDYEILPGNSSKKTYFPIVKFRTYLGQEIHQKSLYGLGATRYLEKGSKVDIIYLENEPTRFMMDLYNPGKVITIMFIVLLFGFVMMVSLITYSIPTWFQDFINGFK